MKPRDPAADPGSAEPPLASEERFRLLVEGVRDYAIFLLDPAGRIVSWNLGAERLKGYTAAEIVGSHFSRFYPSEAIERGWPDHELEVAGREGRFEDEGWRIRKDGTRFWANVVITAMKDGDGRLVGFSKITRDLTDRRRQEDELRLSEERFRLLVEGVQDYALFMLDPDGRVASWNAGAERMKGYTGAEIVGAHFSRFYPADALERGWPQHELSIARRVGRFEDEGWRIRKDGTRFWANVVISAVHDPAGRLVGFAKITRDLTERRSLQLLQEEGKRISQFLAMLAHELRNPLAPIQNAVLLLQPAESTSDTTRRAHAVLQRQVSHLVRIVDDLLDLARINAGKIEVRREPLDLVVLVEQVVDSIRLTTDAKHQSLHLEGPGAAIPVAGDPTRLAQVVLNLLTNANKFTPAGGHIAVAVEQEGGFVQVRVADDGIGLPQDLLSAVFEPFVQGDRTLDRPEGGLGIGLALVRKLVELHGGTVSANSPGIGKGCVFVVQLPVATSQIAAEAVPGAGQPGRERRQVLLVDDNLDATETLGMLLEAWGHDVRRVADGPAALAAVAEWEPDLVLLDIGLPGMDGYQVAEHLRGTSAVLVATTGYGMPEDLERSRAAGFAAHLVKPVDPDHLRDLVEDLVARRRAG